MISPIEIGLELIEPSTIARPLVDSSVDSLADSMGRIGIIQPISVRQTTRFREGRKVESYRVVAGHHRVAAARKLGWSSIPSFVREEGESALAAELVEIDENLCRAELTAAQRAAAIKRRKEIWEAMRPAQSGTTCSTLPETGRGNVQFAADTAKASGQSKQDINRHIARAEALGDDLHEVVGTSLDKGVELDALKVMEPVKRRELIDRAKAGEVVSARVKPEPTLRDERSLALIRLQDAWQQAGETDRKAFIDWAGIARGL